MSAKSSDFVKKSRVIILDVNWSGWKEEITQSIGERDESGEYEDSERHRQSFLEPEVVDPEDQETAEHVVVIRVDQHTDLDS